METKELKVTIPEGYEIDKEKSTFEKIVFKKKETSIPRSWEEYCYQQYKAKNKIGYYIDNTNCIPVEINRNVCLSPHQLKNVLPSKKLTEAFLAMMQLMSLRQAWIGDWEPDWYDDSITKWCIVYQTSNFYVFNYCATSRSLSFPTKEMAIDFMNTFKKLLEIAKPII